MGSEMHAEQGFSIRQAQKATGLSLGCCSLIKRGYVPHKRHWPALLKLVGKLVLVRVRTSAATTSPLNESIAQFNECTRLAVQQ